MKKTNKIPRRVLQEAAEKIRIARDYAVFLDNDILLKRSEIKNSLIQPTPNVIREFVRESRDCDSDVYKREYRLNDYRQAPDKIALNINAGGDVVQTVRMWELENNKFNADLWTPPTKKFVVLTPQILDKLYLFWENFLGSYENEGINRKQNTDPVSKGKVFDLLASRSSNNTNQTPEELREIQTQIEHLTIHFDEGSVHESAGQLKGKFFNKDRQSAKDYLLDKLKDDKDKDIVRGLGTYTLECVAIHVLSKLFNVFSLEKTSVLAAALISELDITAKTEYNNALLAEMQRKKEETEKRIKRNDEKLAKAAMMNEGTDTNIDNIHDEKKLQGTESPAGIIPDQGTDGRHIDQSIQNKSSSNKKSTKKSDVIRKRIRKGNPHAIGGALFSWLLYMELIALKQPPVIRKSKKAIKHVRQPGYVTCLFDIKELPFYSYLPMVCPPVDWDISSPSPLGGNLYLSDFTGGYLTSQESKRGSRPSVSVLANKAGGSFDILVDPNQAKKLFGAVNKLQRQPYKVNTKLLEFLLEHWDELVKCGQLMPTILASINRAEGLRRLNDHFLENDALRACFSYEAISNTLLKNIQSSNFEANIIKIAEAYAGYKFYIPVFLDFRGRNYRYGPFHYHERDLVRSLILFADSEDSPAVTMNTDSLQPVNTDSIQPENTDSVRPGLCLNTFDNFVLSMAFHFIKCKSYEAGNLMCQTLAQWEKDGTKFSDHIFLYVIMARNPFQFLSASLTLYNYMIHDNKDDILCTPVCQDASASAYQMLSYFLLDINMGIHTNLLTVNSKEYPVIHDIYEFMLDQLIEYIRKVEEQQMLVKLEAGKEAPPVRSIANLVRNVFDRNIVKLLYMPKVYGKHEYTMRNDLRVKLANYMMADDIELVSDHCINFWKDNFVKLNQLMDLIHSISWIGAAHDHPVKYSTNYWTTLQDYKLCDSTKVNFQYKTPDKGDKKSSVTLNITTDVRDTRKTSSSSFANFIHQKDAFAALCFMDYLLQYQDNKGAIPLYIVHDNYVTTPEHAAICPAIYRRALVSMGHPLFIINKFIYDNIIDHAIACGIDSFTDEEKNTARQMTDIYNCNVISDLVPKSNPEDIQPIPVGFLTLCLDILRTTKNDKLITDRSWDVRAKRVLGIYKVYASDMISDDGIERWGIFQTHLYQNTDQFKDILSGCNTLEKPDYALHF